MNERRKLAIAEHPLEARVVGDVDGVERPAES
jgi:hypothetical protein